MQDESDHTSHLNGSTEKPKLHITSLKYNIALPEVDTGEGALMQGSEKVRTIPFAIRCGRQIQYSRSIEGCRVAVGCYVSHKSPSYYSGDDSGINLLILNFNGCSYMVFCSSQIWFLSPLKCFFQPFIFSYSLPVDLKAYCVLFHCSFCSSLDTSLILFVFPYYGNTVVMAELNCCII